MKIHVDIGRGLEKCPHLSTRGGEGVKKRQNLVHVVIEWPLSNSLSNSLIPKASVTCQAAKAKKRDKTTKQMHNIYSRPLIVQKPHFFNKNQKLIQISVNQSE